MILSATQTIRPTNMEFCGEDQILIEWTDTLARRYTVKELRDGCPCATCKEKRKHPPVAPILQILSPEETKPLRISSMSPVGNYAYNIEFSDGHNTGIYTFEHLRTLGRDAPIP
jgi:DUF971 family protein